MKKSDYDDFEPFISIIGGTTRFYLYKIFYKVKSNKFDKKKKDFIEGPSQEDDYFGHSNNNFRNLISTIIVMFLFISIIIKTAKAIS